MDYHQGQRPQSPGDWHVVGVEVGPVPAGRPRGGAVSQHTEAVETLDVQSVATGMQSMLPCKGSVEAVSLAHGGSRNTCKGSVFDTRRQLKHMAKTLSQHTEAVETHGKGSVLAAKAVAASKDSGDGRTPASPRSG